MKKLGFLFASLLFACVVFAQSDDRPYQFPVQPGSEKWQSFKTVDDMYAACQVPDDVLARLSTTALIQTCLDYPASSILFIHNNPQQGFEEWKAHFNGISALLARPDSRDQLLAFYKSIDVKGYTRLGTEIEKGEYTFMVQRIEAILVQDEIVGKMDNTQKKLLLRLSVANFNAISSDPLYGFINQKSTGRIIVKLAAALGDRDIKAKIQARPIQEFAATGSLDDMDGFLQIMRDARNIVTR